MPRIPIEDLDEMTVMFLPHGYVAPVVYEIATIFAERWMKNLLYDDDLTLRNSCLSGVYLFSISNPNDEPFNHFATHLYAMNQADPICGNCFAVRIDEHQKVAGLTEQDVTDINRLAYEFFKRKYGR